MCGNRHCFPFVCVVGARWGSRCLFVCQKFLNVLTEEWICEYGRKQKLNSISLCYMFHARRALPTLFYSIWHWEDRLKDLWAQVNSKTAYYRLYINVLLR